MTAEIQKFTMPMVPQVQEPPRTLEGTICEATLRGIPIDVINNLVALHKEFKADAAKCAFDEAFAKAKAEILVVDKDAHVGFKSKDKDKADTDYDHDTLAGIYAAAVPALSKYGLSHSFDVEQVMLPGDNPGEFTQRITVACIISGLGHSKQVKMSGPPDTEGKKTGLKAIASTVTMLSRYTLRAALGLASKKDKSDDDGAAAEAAGGPEKISEAQLKELIALADECEEGTKVSFCRYYRIEGLADLLASKFDHAKKALVFKVRSKDGHA
jgi:ERF superfamily